LIVVVGTGIIRHYQDDILSSLLPQDICTTRYMQHLCPDHIDSDRQKILSLETDWLSRANKIDKRSLFVNTKL
jgi:hypothetical protein